MSIARLKSLFTAIPNLERQSSYTNDFWQQNFCRNEGDSKIKSDSWFPKKKLVLEQIGFEKKVELLKNIF